MTNKKIFNFLENQLEWMEFRFAYLILSVISTSLFIVFFVIATGIAGPKYPSQYGPSGFSWTLGLRLLHIVPVVIVSGLTLFILEKKERKRIKNGEEGHWFK